MNPGRIQSLADQNLPVDFPQIDGEPSLTVPGSELGAESGFGEQVRYISVQAVMVHADRGTEDRFRSGKAASAGDESTYQGFKRSVQAVAPAAVGGSADLMQRVHKHYRAAVCRIDKQRHIRVGRDLDIRLRVLRPVKDVFRKI